MIALNLFLETTKQFPSRRNEGFCPRNQRDHIETGRRAGETNTLSLRTLPAMHRPAPGKNHWRTRTQTLPPEIKAKKTGLKIIYNIGKETYFQILDYLPNGRTVDLVSVLETRESTICCAHPPPRSHDPDTLANLGPRAPRCATHPRPIPDPQLTSGSFRSRYALQLQLQVQADCPSESRQSPPISTIAPAPL